MRSARRVSVRNKENWIKGFLTGIALLFLLFDCYKGFRWPGTWAMSNHLMNYQAGFIPRGLVGAIGSLIFRDYWYTSSLLLFAVMLGITMLLFLYLAYLVCRFTIKEEKRTGMLVMAVLIFSIYPVFTVHEAGYFEQYGYLLVVLMIEIMLACSSMNWILVFAGIFALLSVMISETNAFMVCPVLGTLVLLRIVEELFKKQYQEGYPITGYAVKEELKSGRFWIWMAKIAAAFVPTVAYCIYAGTYRLSWNKANTMIDYYRSKGLDFDFRTSVVYLLIDRRPETEFVYGTLKAFPLQAFLYPLLLLLLTGIFLWYAAPKLVFGIYIVFAVISSFASYFLCTMAWDYQRDMYGMMMAVFLLSIYCLRRYREELPPKIKLGISIFTLIAILCLYSFQIPVLDDKCYYRSGIQLWNDILLKLNIL